MTRIQTTSASLLREVIIGDSQGARMNIVSYVNRVSVVCRYYYKSTRRDMI